MLGSWILGEMPLGILSKPQTDGRFRGRPRVALGPDAR